MDHRITWQHVPTLFGILATGLYLGTASAQQSPPGMDAKESDWVMVYEEPRHRLVFEKDDVRIISVNIPVGDTSMFHLHDVPTVYVAINGALMQNQNRGSEWDDPNPEWIRKPGEILYREDYLAKPLNHRVKNIGEQPFRRIPSTCSVLPCQTRPAIPPAKTRCA